MNREYGICNNMKLKSCLPWRCEYLFLDTPEHRCDRLFIRSEIPVRFKRKEMSHPDHPFVLVFCYFNNRFERTFLKCMADLERTMLLEEHAGYRSACEKIIVPLQEASTLK